MTTPAPETQGSFQTLYVKEKKKARIFLITTVVAFVAFVTTGIGLVTQLNDDSSDKAPSALTRPEGQRDQGQFPGNGQGRGNGGPGFRQDISDFFASDGSVDTDKVDQLTENVPDDFKDRMLSDMSSRIDDAVDDGDITSAQGEALKSALGITS